MLLNAPNYWVRNTWGCLFVAYAICKGLGLQWLSTVCFVAGCIAAVWCITTVIRNKNHIGWVIHCATLTIMIMLTYYFHFI